jgi:Mrp family chromosome partitioning ATPase
VPPNPVSLLESNRMAELLTVLERRFELVVIDSPALSHVSDARPLVGEVSGILIVSAIGRTGRRAAIDFRKQLELLEGNPLGVVANMAPMPRSGYYY